jgi:hypothetical protein
VGVDFVEVRKAMTGTGYNGGECMSIAEFRTARKTAFHQDAEENPVRGLLF